MTAPAAWLLLFAAVSCAPPAAVSGFAENAQKALQQGPAIFSDLKGSCVRRHMYAQPIRPLFMAGEQPGEQFAACTPFDAQVKGLDNTSDVLTAYFRAMQQLASFDTSTVSTAGQAAATNAATAAQLNLAQIDSTGKLAGLVTQLVTQGAQRHELEKLLREAEPAIEAITRGLEDVVGKDYESLLHEEQRSLAARYQNAADVQNLAVILALNRAYSDDMSDWKRRKDSAHAYVEALEQMAETVDNYRIQHLAELSPHERTELVEMTQKLDDIHDQFTVTAIQDTLQQIQADVTQITNVTRNAVNALKKLQRVAEISKLVSAAIEVGADVVTSDFGDIPTAIQNMIQTIAKTADKDASEQKNQSTN